MVPEAFQKKLEPMLSHAASFMVVIPVKTFEEVVSRAGISPKVYRVLTDNASNVRKAFESLPGFDIEKDSDEDDQLEVSEDDVDVQLDKIEIPRGCLVLLILYSSPSTMD